MIISIIAAISKNHIIGINNKIPWHIPQELKYFKSLTLGKPIVMGRKTFASIGQKPLPQRKNIILTRNKNFSASGCVVVNSIEGALIAAGDCKELMIIGGERIYKLFLPLSHKIYLSIIHEEYAGDTYFPKIDFKDWQLVYEKKFAMFTAQIWDKK